MTTDPNAKKPLGPFEIPADREDATSQQSGNTFAIIGPSAADVYREKAAANPRFREAPKSRRGFVIVGEGKRED